MPDNRVLIVGTTPDYIAYIQKNYPRRALFLTDVTKRADAVEETPDKDSEIVCDLFASMQVQTALQDHLDKYHQKLSGVVCYDCEWLALAAKIAKRYELPYPSIEVVKISRNKYLTKIKWLADNVRCPKVSLVQNKSQADKIIQSFGGPVVLKPLTGSGSELTFQCRNNDEISEAFLALKEGLSLRSQLPMYNDKTAEHPSEAELEILAEELITGSEYSADFIIDKEELQIIRIAKKLSDDKLPFGTTFAYLIPGRLPENIDMQVLKEKLLEAAKVLGLDHAICMVDFMLRGDEIIFLELTPRIGGDCIPPLVRQSSGLDTIALALDFGEGKKWKLPGNWVNHVGIRIFAGQNGIFSHINSDELLKDPRVKEVYIKYRSGHEVILPPDDYDSWILGHVIIEPDSSDNDLNQISQIRKKIVVYMEDNR